jgi:hypothetical protein
MYLILTFLQLEEGAVYKFRHIEKLDLATGSFAVNKRSIKRFHDEVA